MGFLKKYFSIYWKQYVLALSLLTIEAIGDLMQPTIMARIIDQGVSTGDLRLVLYLGGIMLAITGVGAAGAIGRNIVSSRVSQSFGAQLRGDLFKKIQGFSFDNVDQFHAASLITRLTNDVNQVQNFAHGMMRIFIKAPILCVGSLIMAYMINPSMACVLTAVVPVIGAIIIINMRVSYPFFIKIQNALDGVNGVMREYLAGIRVVKAFNRFKHEVERFRRANSRLTKVSIKGMRVMSVFNPMMTLTINAGILLVIWLGGARVNSGNMQVGQILAFINYMTQILFSLMMISHVFNMFIRAKASAERIGEVFNQENNLLVPPSSIRLNHAQGRIDFVHITFSYQGARGEPVLKDIHFSCRPGETIGIIGSTGSGKSSLVHLIPRFYDVSSGAVKIDGVDVRDMDIKDLRKTIAMVPQKSILFTGTILENILWGDDKADQEEVERAAQIAQAHSFITSFPEGYHTLLGQGGVNLSGGQKQRVSIARALVRKPSILILDDSTSAVDVETEAKIRAGLKEILHSTTCLWITQRITSVMVADRILVLDNGSMVGVGTHKELMESCSIYQDIYRSQIGKEVLKDG